MDRNYKSQSKKEVAKKILHILRHEFIHHTQQIKKGLNGEEDNYKYITDDENDEKSFIFYFLQDDEIGANAYAYANGGFKDINKAISQKHEPFFDLIKNVYKNANKNEKI
jgi:hypothetical protein